MKVGYFLACEECTPAQPIEQAIAGAEAGFAGFWMGDHQHPRNDEQEQSPMLRPVVGAISRATSLPISTAVTCAALNPGFGLGVGTSEALNEHVRGVAG